MSAPTPWITQDFFAESHFEFGSGTSLQPLLRFSDRCRGFLFIDFELEPGDVENYLRNGFEAISAACEPGDGSRPLALQSIEIFDDLRASHFELACTPDAALRDVRARLAQNGFGVDEYFDYFMSALRGRVQGQWGIEARVIRHIRHADGGFEARPLTLRIAGCAFH